jgi:hypothetical protein
MSSMNSDGLYGLPLERFVPERGALAKELRSSGRREEATAVAALRKPSISAWSVNQLVRTQHHAVADLFVAGDALRDAQSGVLAGSAQAPALREATERERAAVEALLDKARGLLSSDGHEPSRVILDRVAETLHAAALDDDARKLIGDGRLERELRHVGFGAGLGTQPSPTDRRPPASRDTGRAEKAKKRADADKLAARERAKARKVAQTAEAEARRAADRAARALGTAERRRERAAETLRQAEEELAQAQAGAKATAETRREAEQRLEAL